MVLADLGARVIKVEPPAGDPLRQNQDMWATLNRGKKSIVLDLKTDLSKKIIKNLSGKVDIVLEGWRPGVAKRLGADYDTLSSKNDTLVYCSISGFGQKGPWRDRPGHDLNYLALSGYLDVQTFVEGRPWAPPVLISDLTSGLYAAIMVLAAINGKQLTGKGTYVDLSMTEAVISLLGLELGQSIGQFKRYPNVTAIPHYGLFECEDGKWISLGIVHEDHFWQRFCNASGLDNLSSLNFDERMDKRLELRKTLDLKFRSQPSHIWDQLLKEADVPAAKVMELHELKLCQQFRDREVFVDTGENIFIAQPAKFSEDSIEPSKHTPSLGEHNESILGNLGYDVSDINYRVEKGK